MHRHSLLVDEIESAPVGILELCLNISTHRLKFCCHRLGQVDLVGLSFSTPSASRRCLTTRPELCSVPLARILEAVHWLTSFPLTAVFRTLLNDPGFFFVTGALPVLSIFSQQLFIETLDNR
jgi:hypothetical protein